MTRAEQGLGPGGRTWSLEGFQKTPRGWLVLTTDPQGLPTIEDLSACAKAAPERVWASDRTPQQLLEVERLQATAEAS